MGIISETYSRFYHFPTTGLRFLTVYGPYGRPDMAYFDITNKFFNNQPITVFINGDFDFDLLQDFTYVDDIVDGIVRLIDNPPSNESLHEVYNIGNNQPVKQKTFIDTLEKCLSNSLGRPISFTKIYEPIKQVSKIAHTRPSTNSRILADLSFIPHLKKDFNDSPIGMSNIFKRNK